MYLIHLDLFSVIFSSEGGNLMDDRTATAPLSHSLAYQFGLFFICYAALIGPIIIRGDINYVYILIR